MEEKIREMIVNLAEKDDDIRYEAFRRLMSITEEPVPWIYEAWDELTGKFKSDNSYQRTIAMNLFCNLSRCDSQKRIVEILPQLLALTEDEKFITRRQTMQALWKVAWFEPELLGPVVDKYIERFSTCVKEEHPNLLQRDIVQALLTLAELRNDTELSKKVNQLIESEPDPKARKALVALKNKTK
jgi:hypothetical protein